MGVLPLAFRRGENCQSLALDGSETFHIQGIENIQPRAKVRVVVVKSDGERVEFYVAARLDTAVDFAYFKHGGILPFVLRKILSN